MAETAIMFERAEAKKEVVEDFVVMLTQKSTYHRWCLVGSKHHLLADEEIAHFLLECYDQRAADPTGSGVCTTCHSLLTLACVNCGKVDRVTVSEGSAVTVSKVDRVTDSEGSAVTVSKVDRVTDSEGSAVTVSKVDCRSVAAADQTEGIPDAAHDVEHWSTDDSASNDWEVVFQESKEPNTALHQMSLRSRRTVAEKTENRAGKPRTPETGQTSGEKTENRVGKPRTPETGQTSGEKTENRVGKPRTPETGQTSGKKMEKGTRTPETGQTSGKKTENRVGKPRTPETGQTSGKKTENRVGKPRTPETGQTSGKKTENRAGKPRTPETGQTSGEKTENRAGKPRTPETGQTSGNNWPDQKNTSVDRTSYSETSQHPDGCFRAVAEVTVLAADQSRQLGEQNNAMFAEDPRPCQLLEQEVQEGAADPARDPVSSESPRPSRGRPRKYPSIPLECRVCGRKLSTRACVINHMKKKHPETQFPELYDSAPPPAPKPKKGRKRKMESDTAQKESDAAEKGCDEADRSAEETAAGSKRHVSEAVKRLRKAELESLKCATCGAEFQHKKQMYTHRRLCASKVCHLCGKSVKQLEIHLKRHTSVRRFPCPHCPKSFIFHNYLEQHLLYHNNERPYCCEICGMRYREKTRLNAHIRTHTGSKPYKCALCEAAFTRPRGLNDHMRVHTGEKPYSCQVCARLFSSSGNLAAHRRKVHGLQPQVPNRTTRKLFVVDSSAASSSQFSSASTVGVNSPGGLSRSGSLVKTEAVNCAAGSEFACSVVQSSVPASQVLSSVVPTSHSLLHSSFPAGHVDSSVPLRISHIPTGNVDSSVPISHIPSDHVDSSVPISHIPLPGKVSGVYVSKEGSVGIPVLIHSAVTSAGALVKKPFHASNNVHISAEALITTSAGASVGASDLVSGGHSACASAADPLVVPLSSAVPQSSCATTMHPTAFVNVGVTDSKKNLVATLTESDCKHGGTPNHVGVSINASVPVHVNVPIRETRSAPTSVTVPGVSEGGVPVSVTAGHMGSVGNCDVSAGSILSMGASSSASFPGISQNV